METSKKGIISVLVDSKAKEETKTILKDSGLKQVIKRKDIPFEMYTLYSDELENALKESILIENEYKEGKRKGYNSANEMLRSILED